MITNSDLHELLNIQTVIISLQNIYSVRDETLKIKNTLPKIISMKPTKQNITYNHNFLVFDTFLIYLMYPYHISVNSSDNRKPFPVLFFK